MSLAADTTRGQDARITTTRAVCSYCGVGCGIDVTTTGADPTRTVAKVSGDRSHPANHGRLCTKGATHVELMAAPGRMTTALVRPARGEEAVPAALDDAIEEAGRRLRGIVDEHGPDAVAVYVSGQMSTEAQYLSNKLVKGFLRGRHLESNSRLCMASAGTGYKQSLGADGPPGSYEDIDDADLFFVFFTIMTHEPHAAPAFVQALTAATSAQPSSCTAPRIVPAVTLLHEHTSASSGRSPVGAATPPSGMRYAAGSAPSSPPTSGRSDPYADASPTRMPPSSVFASSESTSFL